MITRRPTVLFSVCVFAVSFMSLSGCSQSESDDLSAESSAPLPPPPVAVAAATDDDGTMPPAAAETPKFADEPAFVDDPPATIEPPGIAALTPPGLDALELPEPGPSDAWHQNWSTDFEAAKKQAETEGKDILVDFTGTEWCMWCIRLGAEVFRHDEFTDFAKKHFVLVEVDFPQNALGQPEATTPEHEELAERFGVESFPTIFLFDAQGRPYAQTGYQPGGPEAYNEHLADLRQIRVERDEALAAADGLKGIERAKKLDEALIPLASDLTFPAYASIVEEIISLDASNEAGLQEEYAERLANHQFMTRIQALERKVPAAEAPDALLAEVDGIARDLGNNPRRKFILYLIRINILGYFDKVDDVLAVADGALKDESLDADYRAQLYISQLRVLNQADRHDDAISVIDNAIAEFDDNDSMKMEFFLARTDFLVKLDREEEARAAIQEARKAGGDAAAFRIDQFEAAVLGSVSIDPSTAPVLPAPAEADGSKEEPTEADSAE